MARQFKANLNQVPREVIPSPGRSSYRTKLIALTTESTANLKESVQIKLEDGTSIQVGSSSLLNKKLIGSGTFGNVYSVDIKGSNGHLYQVAVKEMKNEIDPDQQSRDLVWKFNHDNITPFYGAFKVNSRASMITELATCSLDKVYKNILKIKGSPPPVESRIGLQFISRIGYEMIQGLNYMFLFSDEKAYRVIHKDLKPENVLLFRGGPGEPDRVKLCDFGISNFLQTNSYCITLGRCQSNCAPEAFKGECQIESDVWSLGYTLLKLHLMECPFGDLKDIALEWKVTAHQSFTDKQIPHFEINDCQLFENKEEVTNQFRKFINSHTMNPKYCNRMTGELYSSVGDYRKRYDDLLVTSFIKAGMRKNSSGQWVVRSSGLIGFLDRYYVEVNSD